MAERLLDQKRSAYLQTIAHIDYSFQFDALFPC